MIAITVLLIGAYVPIGTVESRYLDSQDRIISFDHGTPLNFVPGDVNEFWSELGLPPQSPGVYIHPGYGSAFDAIPREAILLEGQSQVVKSVEVGGTLTYWSRFSTGDVQLQVIPNSDPIGSSLTVFDPHDFTRIPEPMGWTWLGLLLLSLWRRSG